jgi:hypothetical protein
MNYRRFFEFLISMASSTAVVMIVFTLSAVLSSAAHAQTLLASAPLPDEPTPSAATAPPIAITPIVTTRSHGISEHKFWDAQNRLLLTAAAISNGADFAVTRANLQSGGQELNPVVRVFGRSTAGLALNFAGETASIISLSYFFHKTGHHRLERATSLVNIGASAGAVTYGLLHR